MYQFAKTAITQWHCVWWTAEIHCPTVVKGQKSQSRGQKIIASCAGSREEVFAGLCPGLWWLVDSWQSPPLFSLCVCVCARVPISPLCKETGMLSWRPTLSQYDIQTYSAGTTILWELGPQHGGFWMFHTPNGWIQRPEKWKQRTSLCEIVRSWKWVMRVVEEGRICPF